MALFQSKHVWVNQLAEGVAVLMLDCDQSPLNFVDRAMIDLLDRALNSVAESASVRLLLIRSAKTATFCHGPSPLEMGKWKEGDFLDWTDRGQKLCTKLADLPMPTVCVIAGTCYDAGLELALACDYRVVVNGPTTSLGFPQLEWGMIPSWGATQRLPHLIGLENSLQMLMAGQQFDAREAWVSNLADHLTDDIDESPPPFLANPEKRDWSGYPSSTWRQRWLESNRPGRWFLFRGAERILRTRIPEEMPAPAEMLLAIRHAYEAPTLVKGLESERQAVRRIVDHPAVHNLMRLLERRERLRQPGLGSSQKERSRRVAVIGGDTAALALLLHSIVQGQEVVLRSNSEEALGTGLAQIVRLLQEELNRGAMSSSGFQKALTLIRGTYTWTHFDQVDLILDTTGGPLGEKQQFYCELERQISPTTLIVPITGLYRVADLRQGLQHPQRVIGMHLIEPWSRASVAEIVAPDGANHLCAKKVREWAVGMGKCCLHAPDEIGGIVMRVWLPALNEAGLMVKEGVRIDRIDQAMRRFGMSYGPLEWMDRLGIDQIAVLVSAMQSAFAGRINLESGFGLLAEKQWLGRRSGAGFYHRPWRTWKPNREAAKLWQTDSRGEAIHEAPALSELDEQHWIQERLVTLTVLEALRCLDAGMINDANDLDCAMCMTGWATHRGGPIGYVRQLGIQALTDRCTTLERIYGPRFAPIPVVGSILASLT